MMGVGRDDRGFVSSSGWKSSSGCCEFYWQWEELHLPYCVHLSFCVTLVILCYTCDIVLHM